MLVIDHLVKTGLYATRFEAQKMIELGVVSFSGFSVTDPSAKICYISSEKGNRKFWFLIEKGRVTHQITA